MTGAASGDATAGDTGEGTGEDGGSSDDGSTGDSAFDPNDAPGGGDGCDCRADGA